MFQSGKIRKNSKKKIKQLLDMALFFELSNYSFDMYSDCYTYDDPVIINQEKVLSFIDENYGDLAIFLTCHEDGSPKEMSISCFSGYICVCFNKQPAEEPQEAEKHVIRAFSPEYYEWLNESTETTINVQPITVDSGFDIDTKGTAFYQWITKMISEKGVDVDQTINLDGVYGFTYHDLINLFDMDTKANKQMIKQKLIEIDFNNGDVFALLNHLAKGFFDSPNTYH